MPPEPPAPDESEESILFISSIEASVPKALAVFLACPSVPLSDLFNPLEELPADFIELPADFEEFPTELIALVVCFVLAFAELDFLPNNLPKTPAITFATVITFPITVLSTLITGVKTATRPLPIMPRSCFHCSWSILTWFAHVPLVLAKSPCASDNCCIT